MIAVDPHKASNTAAVLDPPAKTLIATARFANTADGYVQLDGFACSASLKVSVQEPLTVSVCAT